MESNEVSQIGLFVATGLIAAPSVFWPLTAEDLNGWTCLIDAVVPFVPFQFQVAAAEMINDPPLSAAGEHAGHADSTGAGAAS